MHLQQRHINALDKAETLMFHSDFCPYLELKELLPDASSHARRRFRSLFTTYYGLNVGGLTDAFRDRFFEILFGKKVIANGQPAFRPILNELSSIPRKRGDCAVPFSFVSKLVAIHWETSPIYDRHVRAFFVKEAPAASQPKEDRIAWYIGFLDQVAADYTRWAQDGRLIPIMDRLKARDQRLPECAVVRLVDFLVWKAGKENLL
jgi:hypothetical protein